MRAFACIFTAWIIAIAAAVTEESIGFQSIVDEPPTFPSRIQRLYELIFPNHLHQVFASNATLFEASRQEEQHLAPSIGNIGLGCATYEVGASVGKFSTILLMNFNISHNFSIQKSSITAHRFSPVTSRSRRKSNVFLRDQTSRGKPILLA